METKFCYKCERELPLSMYYKDKSRKDGLSCYCKECRLSYAKEHHIKVREKHKAYKKKYWQENKHRFVEERKQYRDAHIEDMRIYHKKHYEENREEILADGYRRKKERLKTDPIFKYKEQIRHFVWMGFNRKGFKKSAKTEQIVGCTAEELRAYLNETFYKNYGYEYDGTENVHIDHVVPLAVAKTEEDVIKLCHYTNLQLLKASDNLKKSAKCK